MNSTTVLAFDLGGTSLKSALVDTLGNITERDCLPISTLRAGTDFVGDFLAHIAARVTKTGAMRVGIAVPGVLNAQRTMILEAPNVTELEKIELMNMLTTAIPHCAFYMENDAALAALGTLQFDKQIDTDTFAYVTIGTGIGCSVVIEGQIFKGGNGNALELGLVLSEGREYIETLVAKEGLCRMANQIQEGLYTPTPERIQFSDPKIISEAADAGNKAALLTLHKAGELLGESLCNMIVLLDVTTIFIGGGIAPVYNFLADGIQTVLQSRLLPYYTSKLVLQKSALGNDSGVLGAAALCFSTPNA